MGLEVLVLSRRKTFLMNFEQFGAENWLTISLSIKY